MRRPLQVYLEDQDLARLETWAAGRGWTKSQAIRAAVRALTRLPAEDPLLELSGDIEGLPEDASTNLQRYLDETYVAEPTAPIARGADGPVPLFVDRGAWIALRSQRDQHHAEADRLFREALRRRLPLVTTPLVIAEVHRLTLFRVGVQAALRGLDRIDASPSVTIHFANAEEHRAARRWLERLAPRPITYTDAVSFAVMEATRCRHVLGFDQDFVAAGYSLWQGHP